MNRQACIGIIGYGAIGRSVATALASNASGYGIGVVLVRDPSKILTDPTKVCVCDVGKFIALRPRLFVECAGHTAVREVVPELLVAGIDGIVLSVGAFADPATLDDATKAAKRGSARLIMAAGALGGLDALRSARRGGLSQVTYVGRKPPAAWIDTPAANIADLRSVREPIAIFEGDARTAAALYPKNANVTAAVALAGIGFSDTRVTLVADPTVCRNVHEIKASGAFGQLHLKIENEPMSDNPKTSWLAALSVEQLIRRELNQIDI